MGLETILGIASLVVSAVGTGLSVQSQNNAAKSQEQLSLLNLQSQRQAAPSNKGACSRCRRK